MLKRVLTPAQRAVVPLTPVFEACQQVGLAITPANREKRLLAVNHYCKDFSFRFIESFKEMTSEPGMAEVVADAIAGRWLSW